MTPKNLKMERRFTSGEIEVRSKGGQVFIEGHAAVFDRLSQNLGGFVERVMRTAFEKTLKEADVRALKNHDPNYVLGRNTARTLDLATDDSGLYYRIIPPDTSYARDLLVSLERGDVDQSSFAFYAVEDDWGLTENDFPVRDLLQVSLIDVSVVTYPAYLDTDAGTAGRSVALAGLAKRAQVDVIDLADSDAIKRAIGEKKISVPKGPGETHPDKDTVRIDMEAMLKKYSIRACSSRAQRTVQAQFQ
jgi:HK97 family phage prohead protease